MLSKIEYQTRVPVLEELDRVKRSQILNYMEVQVCKSVKALKAIEWDIDHGVRSQGMQVLDHDVEDTFHQRSKATVPKKKTRKSIEVTTQKNKKILEKGKEEKGVRTMKQDEAVTIEEIKPKRRAPRKIPDRTNTDPVIRVVELPSIRTPPISQIDNKLLALMTTEMRMPPPSSRITAEEVFTDQELQDIFMSTGA